MLAQFFPDAKSDADVQDSLKAFGLGTMSAEDVARTILWLLSEDSVPVYGSNINVGNGTP
jgi:chanoclavine-I dehydrogenase